MKQRPEHRAGRITSSAVSSAHAVRATEDSKKREAHVWHSQEAAKKVVLMLHRSRLFIDRQGQLLWKEFNYFSGYSIPNFDKMVGNPVVRYVLIWSVCGC